MKVIFSEAAKGKLDQLSMAIEINGKKRFSYRRESDELTEMLKYATSSKNAQIQEKLQELKEQLTERALTVFTSLGVNFNKEIKHEENTTQRTYRGQPMENTASAKHSTQEKDTTKKKKIVYRGKTTYI